MGKVRLLLLLIFLISCAPAPTAARLSPTPGSTSQPILTEGHPGNLTLVEFFAVT